jgi:hydrogenase/urease accessory protein HupE
MRLLHVILFTVALTQLSTAFAHKLRPTIVNLNFSDQLIELSVEANAEALLAGIGAGHDNTDDAPEAEQYKMFRALSPDELATRFASFADSYKSGLMLSISNKPVSWIYDSIDVPDVADTRLARKSIIYFHASLPLHTGDIVWSSEPVYGDMVVNFVNHAGEKASHWLVDGQASPPFKIQQPMQQREWKSVFADYSVLGFLHILPKGMDHILFVLGLFLLSRKAAPLLWQVTAFTVAHSITLALSVYGVISLSAAIVEPLIALSIAYVGIENLLTRELKPWRVVVVFLFGLLHGMGFAEVLFELGLPESEFVTALISFNLGVEAGQLAVILLALAAVFWLRSQDQLYRRLVVIPGSLIITCMGLFWVWQRIAL